MRSGLRQLSARPRRARGASRGRPGLGHALASALLLLGAPYPGLGAEIGPGPVDGDAAEVTLCETRREALQAIRQLAGAASTDLLYLEPFTRGVRDALRSLEGRTWRREELASLDFTVHELEEPDLPPIVLSREWDPESGWYDLRIRPRFMVRADLRAEKAYADGALLAEALLALERLPACPSDASPEGERDGR